VLCQSVIPGASTTNSSPLISLPRARTRSAHNSPRHPRRPHTSQPVLDATIVLLDCSRAWRPHSPPRWIPTTPELPLVLLPRFQPTSFSHSLISFPGRCSSHPLHYPSPERRAHPCPLVSISAFYLAINSSTSTTRNTYCYLRTLRCDNPTRSASRVVASHLPPRHSAVGPVSHTTSSDLLSAPVALN